MSERLAKMMAEELRGEAYDSGGGVWLVLWTTAEGLVAMSDAGMALYQNRTELDSGDCNRSIDIPCV